MGGKKIKTIGVLGGMGPYATLMFFKNILDLTSVKSDLDHIRIIIDNNPHIPSPSRTILYGEESPVERMIESCRQLASYPVDLIVLPCNTACYFLPEVQRNIKTPILNIIDIASEEMHVKHPNSKRVSVLGGMVTYLKETYKESLRKRGLQFIHHDEKTQKVVVNLIEKVKVAKKKSLLKKSFWQIIDRIKNNNTEAVILACTELTLFREFDIGMPIVDSSYALAEYTVEIASGNRQIPLDTERVYKFWKERAQMLIEGKVSEYQSTLFTSDAKSAKERDLFEKKKLLGIVKTYNGYFKDIAIEFGCGIGRMAEVLSKYFNHIDALDYCEDFINIAKARAKKGNINNIDYFVSKGEEFEPNKKYNCAIISGLMNFLDDKQFSRLVEIVAESLKFGGTCILRESVGYHNRFELHGFHSKILNTDYHAVYRSSDEIVNEFSKYGFALKHEEITLPPTPDKPETCQKILVLEK